MIFFNKKKKNDKEYKNSYDAVNPAHEKHRRKAIVEFENEDDGFKNYDRLKAVNIGRDLERNFSTAKSMLNQFRINVIGSLGKLQFNSDDNELNRAVEHYFNSVWSKDCDSRDDMHWCEMLQNAVTAVKREHDCLCVFDDFDEDDGKLLWFESDQLVMINEAHWKAKSVENGWFEIKAGRKIPLVQNNGIITDSKGRVKAYVVTGQHGMGYADWDDVTILPKNVAKLLKRPFRFNQTRGVSDIITASSELEDIYEMRTKELQSAKVASSFAGVVTKKNAQEEVIMRGGDIPDDILEEDTVTNTEPQESYDSLESMTGGYMEYLNPEEDFKILDFNRPNLNTKEFFEFVQVCAGAGMGLSKSYTTLTPAGSYTAFRGDMLLAWATFYENQKWIERRLCDWVAERVLSWAMRKRKIQYLPKNWGEMISWQFPKMPQVDPLKEVKAHKEALDAGLETYSKVLGATWEDQVKQLAKEYKIIKDNELPLDILNQKEAVNEEVVRNEG